MDHTVVTMKSEICINIQYTIEDTFKLLVEIEEALTSMPLLYITNYDLIWKYLRKLFLLMAIKTSVHIIISMSSY